MSSKGSSHLNKTIVGLLLCSAAINLILAEQLKDVRQAVAKLKSETSLSIGESLPDIEARYIDGTRANFSYGSDSRPTVLYFFSPSCGWCQRNEENVHSLYSQKSGDYRFVGISISNEYLNEYLSDARFDFPVLTDLSTGTVMSYKIGGTPQTVVVSKEGKVIANWVGAYMNQVKTDIEDFFEIGLPGIRN